MKSHILHISLIFLLFSLFYSCVQSPTEDILIEEECNSNILPFRNDSTLSDKNGFSNDYKFILPRDLLNDTASGLDTQSLSYQTPYMYLFLAHEPNLYNYYLNKEVLRITNIVAAWNIHKFYIVENSKNKINLIFKSIEGFCLDYFEEINHKPYIWGSLYCDTIPLSNVEWEQIMNKIDSSGLFCKEIVKETKSITLDGEGTTFELHSKKGHSIFKYNGRVTNISIYDEIQNQLRLKVDSNEKYIKWINNFYHWNTIILRKNKIDSLSKYNFKNWKTPYVLKENKEFINAISKKNELIEKYNNSSSKKEKEILYDSLLISCEKLRKIIEPYEQRVLVERNYP